MKVYQDIRLADPFLRPNWRHERVVRMLSTTPPARCNRFDDEWIKTYKKFLFSWHKNNLQRERLLYEMPGIYFAYNVHDRISTDPEMALLIESRLLAGMPTEDIANDCKTIPETIEWYEKLFFNVSDFLEHNDWIVKHVLYPAIDGFYIDSKDSNDKKAPAITKPYLDMTLKLFSYFGGPIMCDIMINGFKRDNKLKNAEDLSSYMNEQFMLQVERRSLQAMCKYEINTYNVMELFNIHSRIIELKNSAKNADTQHTDFEKHVNAMLLAIPWNVGRSSKQKYEGTIIGKFDDSAVELDSEEIVMSGFNQEPDTAKELLYSKPYTDREV